MAIGHFGEALGELLNTLAVVSQCFFVCVGDLTSPSVVLENENWLRSRNLASNHDFFLFVQLPADS